MMLLCSHYDKLQLPKHVQQQCDYNCELQALALLYNCVISKQHHDCCDGMIPYFITLS
jgi:hypothetical protein